MLFFAPHVPWCLIHAAATTEKRRKTLRRKIEFSKIPCRPPEFPIPTAIGPLKQHHTSRSQPMLHQRRELPPHPPPQTSNCFCVINYTKGNGKHYDFSRSPSTPIFASYTACPPPFILHSDVRLFIRPCLNRDCCTSYSTRARRLQHTHIILACLGRCSVCGCLTKQDLTQLP